MDGAMPDKPDFTLEDEARALGHERIAGVDEAGRGPLAGPVVAAAVVLDPLRLPAGIDDSKRLSESERRRLHGRLLGSARVGIGQAGVEEIDRLNIREAARLAMARALDALGGWDFALVDGLDLPPGAGFRGRAVVAGDRLSLSVAAASIVAKTCRDSIMVALAQQHPGYGWERNKGYGSESHIEALQRLGPTPIHRRSFAPLRKMLWQEGS
jgi:ribonuclease HII